MVWVTLYRLSDQSIRNHYWRIVWSSLDYLVTYFSHYKKPQQHPKLVLWNYYFLRLWTFSPPHFILLFLILLGDFIIDWSLQCELLPHDWVINPVGVTIAWLSDLFRIIFWPILNDPENLSRYYYILHLWVTSPWLRGQSRMSYYSTIDWSFKNYFLNNPNPSKQPQQHPKQVLWHFTFLGW